MADGSSDNSPHGVKNARINGVVKFWLRKSGWGFITTDLDDPEAIEYFVHCSDVVGYSDDRPLQKNLMVTFLPVKTLIDGEEKARASEVRIVPYQEGKQ